MFFEMKQGVAFGNFNFPGVPLCLCDSVVKVLCMNNLVNTLRVPKTGGIPTTKATVLHWLKRKGDAIAVGDPVVELETDKVSYELESPVEGVLLEIIAEENAQVPVGGSLCQIGQPVDVHPDGPRTDASGTADSVEAKE
jgi:pyruvate/2-oxoglutarate dehydrogenase complex dihydrolipoamide acyltransferase (E2) component